MGRKKIEIRPLIDERNRNVTFLKRKAGLMKKAWELSVLCAADVSILIFSNNGKPYEFSSRELDGEIDRYLEYEGMIERRRAPEFAAAAAAGEDDDDDDDETERRGSIKGKQGGPPGPGKSLKGKESFKPRQPSRSDYAKARRRRKDRRDGSERRGFIEGLVSHPSSDEDEDEKPVVAPHDRGQRHESDLSSMQYAMNLHQSSSYPPQSSARLSYPSQQQQPYRDQPLQPSYSSYNQQPNYPSQPSQTQYQSAYPPPTSQPPSNAFMPNNMQWDQDMLSRYAEFQLQQNHQRQQRILLERQRHQLAELGIPVDDTGLLDQLFAGGMPPPQASSSHSHGTPQGDDTDSGGFIWPTAPVGSSSRHTNHGHNNHAARGSMPVSDAAPAPNGMLDHLYSMGRDGGAAVEGDETGFAWPTGGQAFLPSPDSAEGQVIADKKRIGSPYGGPEDKRSRLY